MNHKGVLLIWLIVICVGCSNSSKSTQSVDGLIEIGEHAEVKLLEPEDIDNIENDENSYIIDDTIAKDINEFFGIMKVINQDGRSVHNFDSSILINGDNLNNISDFPIKDFTSPNINDISTVLSISSYTYEGKLEECITYIIDNPTSYINSVLKILIINQQNCKISVSVYDHPVIQEPKRGRRKTIMINEQIDIDGIFFYTWIEFEDLKEIDLIDKETLIEANKIKDDLIDVFLKYKPNFEEIDIIRQY